MKRFLLRLIAPRPTFAQDMTEAERRVMREHVAYWKGLFDKRIAVVFGPVLDPKGVWGVAIIEVADEAEGKALVANDPTVKAGVGAIELYPMFPDAMVRKMTVGWKESVKTLSLLHELDEPQFLLQIETLLHPVSADCFSRVHPVPLC